MMSFVFRGALLWPLLPLVLATAGCTSGFQAALETLRFAALPDKKTELAALNPNFEYLRTRVNGRLLFLALGYQGELGFPKDTRTYYSGDGEILRVTNGRIIHFVGQKREVRIRLPDLSIEWPETQAVAYRRFVDYRSAYQFNQPQDVTLRRLNAAPKNIDLLKWKPSDLLWFEERTQESGRQKKLALYGVLQDKESLAVVYAEQCLEQDLCFSFQRWRSSGAY